MTPSRRGGQDKLPAHSRKKIRVYETYLKHYLSVMCESEWENINIWEPFAGPGIYEDGNKGSPLKAAEIIHKKRIEKPNKRVNLFVNEREEHLAVSLRQVLQGFEFAQVSVMDAKNFVGDICASALRRENSDAHNFIFIDPYGYSQISVDTLKNLLNIRNFDYLIFIPTFHIYRFRDDRHSDYKPAREFLVNLRISEESLDKVDHYDELAEEIQNVLKDMAAAKFSCRYELKNGGNRYHLFFISRNAKGGETFLSVIDSVEKDEDVQQDFLFRESIKSNIKSLLGGSDLDNRELYEGLLAAGRRSKYVNPVLKELEKDNEVEVIDISNSRHGKNCYMNLKETDRRKILFRLAPQE